MESWISIFCLGVPYARCQGVQPEVPSPSSVALLLRHFVLKGAGMTTLTPSALPCGYRLRLGGTPQKKIGPPKRPEGKFAEVTRKRKGVYLTAVPSRTVTAEGLPALSTGPWAWRLAEALESSVTRAVMPTRITAIAATSDTA